MYRGLLLCLILTGLISCASYGPSGMSANMQKIVASLRTDGTHIDTSGLYGGDKEEFQYMRRQSRMELYEVPTPPGEVDALRYAIYYDKEDKEYWVTCFGGVEGSPKLFGPTKFPPKN